ncbi:MAG TPA: hypothetical protein VJ464_14840 [Blastocatellia bacterium]|nr:hypothetical protein [Blastocatellia bacterium]
MRNGDRQYQLNRLVNGTTWVLLISTIACWSSQAPRITPQETEKMVKQNLPLGSTRAKVTEFIESLKIDDLKIVHDDYHSGPPPSPDDLPKNVKADISGYLVAAILKVENNGISGTYNIRIVFYFDSNERLIDYAISKRGQVN